MSDGLTNWKSPVGLENALTLRTLYASAFEAIAEFDRIGHLLLYRAGQTSPVVGVEQIVGIALLRRAVTLFAAMRELFEGSLIDPAKVIARSYFESWMQYRCLAYGSMDPIALETSTTAAEREPRARCYYVASERRGLRARALIVAPGSRFPPHDSANRNALHHEILSEIELLRREYQEEWTYFGDLTEETILKRVGSRDEPSWFARVFLPAKVNSIRALADAFGYGWDYEFLYDSWSAVVHGRGIRQDVTIEGDQLAVHHPHDPSWFQLLAFFVVGWHSMLLMTAAKWHSPVMIPQLQALYLKHKSAIDKLGTIQDVPDFLA